MRHYDDERRVLNLFATQTAMECFSRRNKEQFDQTFLKFVGQEYKDLQEFDKEKLLTSIGL